MPLNTLSLSAYPSQSRHCAYCVQDKDPIPETDDTALIFLDIDGVMANGLALPDPDTHFQIENKRIALFGENNAGTPLKTRVAMSYFLKSEAVDRLMTLIHTIELVGKKVRIVISSAWGKDGTTEQSCKEMFKSQPFSQYIVGRTASTKNYDPEYAKIPDKETFIKEIKDTHDITLKNRGEEIKHWILTHNVTNFVIFDDCNDGIKTHYKKRFVQTGTLIRDTHIKKALVVLGIMEKHPKIIRGAHCELCNLDREKLQSMQDKAILFLDIEGTLTREPLVDPATGNYKKNIPFDEKVELILKYLISKIEARGKEVGIVLTSKWPQTITTHEICAKRFKNTFISEYILGQITNHENGVREWIQSHGVKYSARIDSTTVPSLLDQRAADAIYARLRLPKRPLKMPSKRHCPFCIYDKKSIKKIQDMALIYIDVAGAFLKSYLRNGRNDPSHPELFAPPVNQLDKKSVGRLMHLIKMIEAAGNKVGLILTSDWRESATTENICKEMFASTPLRDYFIGKIPSNNPSDPDRKEAEKKYRPWEFKVRNTLPLQIHFWDTIHRNDVNIGNKSLVIEGGRDKLNRVGTVIIPEPDCLFDWKDVEEAQSKLSELMPHKKVPKKPHYSFCIWDNNEYNKLSKMTLLFVEISLLYFNTFKYRNFDTIVELTERARTSGHQVGIALYSTFGSLDVKAVYAVSRFFGCYLVGKIPYAARGDQRSSTTTIRAWQLEHGVKNFVIIGEDDSDLSSSFKDHYVDISSTPKGEIVNEALKIIRRQKNPSQECRAFPPVEIEKVFADFWENIPEPTISPSGGHSNAPSESMGTVKVQHSIIRCNEPKQKQDEWSCKKIVQQPLAKAVNPKRTCNIPAILSAIKKTTAV